MDLASRSRTCRTVRAARPGRQGWLSKGLHLPLRQDKSHPAVVEASCWTTAEDTCWTTAVAVCWRSNCRTQTSVPYRYVCIKDNIRRCVSAVATDTTAITPPGLRRCRSPFRCSRKNQPSCFAERSGKRLSFGSDRSRCSKYSIVFINPSCSCTLGSHWSSFLAKLMSGQRCFGSSSGRGR